MVEYIRTENLKPGDILAKTLYDENGRILLTVGKVVTDTAIRVIRQYGYKGVYIENINEFRREDIPIPAPLVDDYTQLQLIAVLRNIYENKAIQYDYFDPRFMMDKKKLHEIVEDVVNTLREAEREGRLLFELEDSRNMTSWLYYHSVNVCYLSIGMAIKPGLTKPEIMEIALGAIYHDLGKAWFADTIVNKRELTEVERIKLREHPEKMFRFLQKHNYTVSTLYGVWQHHEKENGEGYPFGLKGGKIVNSAKIVACANAYDNLINMNPYEDALSMYQADAIEYMSVNEQQDIECLRMLFQIVVPYPAGTKVRLSNGAEGIVLKNFPDYPLRPAVIIGKDMILLHKDPVYRNITIAEVIKP